MQDERNKALDRVNLLDMELTANTCCADPTTTHSPTIAVAGTDQQRAQPASPSTADLIHPLQTT
jgi:hypothetical protein